jgi:hypothetical protein
LAVVAFAAAGADSLPERPLSCLPTFALPWPLFTSGYIWTINNMDWFPNVVPVGL